MARKHKELTVSVTFEPSRVKTVVVSKIYETLMPTKPPTNSNTSEDRTHFKTVYSEKWR